MTLRKPQNKQGYVCVGLITDAHGLKGEVKLKSFTSLPMDMGNYPLETETGTALKLSHVRQGPRGLVLARVEDVTDRDAAEALKGTFVYTQRENLPDLEEGEAYFDDLRGLTVVTEAGESLGTIADVFDTGANAVMTIKTDDGDFMLPYTADVVVSVNETQVTVTDFAIAFKDV